MNIYKSILFSTVITGISVSNFPSTLSYSPYIMGELSKADQEYKSALRTHNISHQKFPKIQPLNIPIIKQCNYTTSCEESTQQTLRKQERIKNKVRLDIIKYAANFFANYLQNWYKLCIFITNMPQNITEENFFKEAEKILNNKRITLHQPFYPQNIIEDNNRIIYLVQVINDKISFIDNAIKDYQSNCKAHNVVTNNKHYLLQLTIGYIKHIMLSRYKQSDILSIYNFLNNHQNLVSTIFKNDFEKFLSFLKDTENCSMSYNSIDSIITNYIN